jgi:hypothetical protein
MVNGCMAIGKKTPFAMQQEWPLSKFIAVLKEWNKIVV